MSLDFSGKTALVTGGGSGIGRATALALGKAGANVVIGNRNVERGEGVVKEIVSTGGKAVFQRTDVTKPDDVESLVAKAVSEFGGLDLAFNNSGVEGEMGPLHEQSVEGVENVLDVNVKAVFTSLKFEIAEMLKRGCGAIVNTSSILGLKGVGNLSVYVASKHAVAGITKSVALDYAQQGIRVNAVAPGPIETRMLNDVSGGNPDSFAQAVPMGRIGQPEEIADAVLWLLSDQASFVTGHTLPVDGGGNAN